jgi:hypothetical protein
MRIEIEQLTGDRETDGYSLARILVALRRWMSRSRLRRCQGSILVPGLYLSESGVWTWQRLTDGLERSDQVYRLALDLAAPATYLFSVYSGSGGLHGMRLPDFWRRMTEPLKSFRSGNIDPSERPPFRTPQRREVNLARDPVQRSHWSSPFPSPRTAIAFAWRSGREDTHCGRPSGDG